VALLEKFIVHTVHIPVKKNSHMLRPLNDNLWLKLMEVYGTTCESRNTYRQADVFKQL
jgi:hypothetical protein